MMQESDKLARIDQIVSGTAFNTSKIKNIYIPVVVVGTEENWKTRQSPIKSTCYGLLFRRKTASSNCGFRGYFKLWISYRSNVPLPAQPVHSKARENMPA